MAERKQFFGVKKTDPQLAELLQKASTRTVTEEELREQRISFAFGNAPASAQKITKDSIRHASKNIRLKP